MDSEAVLLPEPFSEKNIDGSPISKSEEGKSLFRNPGRKDRRLSERRAGDRRSGSERRAQTEYADLTGGSGSDGYGAPEPARPEPEEYRAPEPARPEPEEYRAPEPARPEPEEYRAPEPARPELEEYRAPEPVRTETGVDTYGMDEAFDSERFEPPVDEKPGMIPNPMKMPPVKKKSSLDYDLDQDYGDYGTDSVEDSASAVPETDDGGYGYYSDDNKDTGYDYGYGDENGTADHMAAEPPVNTEDDPGYGGYYEDTDMSSVDNDDSDDGGYGDYDSGGDDYGSDYGSGSDYSSDYY